MQVLRATVSLQEPVSLLTAYKIIRYIWLGPHLKQTHVASSLDYEKSTFAL